MRDRPRNNRIERRDPSDGATSEHRPSVTSKPALEAALRERFDFTERDLESNRRGELSFAQRQQLEAEWRADARWVVLAFSGVLLAIALFIVLFEDRGSLGTRMAFALPTWGVATLFLWWCNVAVWPAQPPTAATGTVTFRHHRIAEVLVGDRKPRHSFVVRADDRQLFEGITTATVYFQRDSKRRGGRILSVEVLEYGES